MVASIYNHYVNETVVTFDERPITTEEMARRIEEVRSAALPWLVAEHDNQVVGYAYASPWKRRAAYRFSVEITVYLDQTARTQTRHEVIQRALCDIAEGNTL
jgi:phosphinothricin acetyltransferase